MFHIILLSQRVCLSLSYILEERFVCKKRMIVSLSCLYKGICVVVCMCDMVWVCVLFYGENSGEFGLPIEFNAWPWLTCPVCLSTACLLSILSTDEPLSLSFCICECELLPYELLLLFRLEMIRFGGVLAWSPRGDEFG